MILKQTFIAVDQRFEASLYSVATSRRYKIYEINKLSNITEHVNEIDQTEQGLG